MADKFPSTIDDDNDFVSLVSSLSNYIQNERVRAYNEGSDDERDRCAKIADEHAMSECRTVAGSETEAMRLGARSIAERIRNPD